MQEIRRTYDLDALEELLNSLMDASSQGAAVIVEGRRDELALRSLGLRGPMIMASRRPALDLAEDAARRFRKIVMLTDWDAKGDEMALNIDMHLRSMGVQADLDMRNKLKKLVKKEIKDVQSLSLYMERARDQHAP